VRVDAGQTASAPADASVVSIRPEVDADPRRTAGGANTMAGDHPHRHLRSAIDHYRAEAGGLNVESARADELRTSPAGAGGADGADPRRCILIRE